MGLLVRIVGLITLPDGTTAVAQVERGDLVFNPDMTVEAELARQTAERLAGEVVERLAERITDWGQTLTRMSEAEDGDGD